MAALSRTKITQLLKGLNTELAGKDIVGELYLVGGAVMCLVFKARPSTQDIDAVFAPAAAIREAAARLAARHGLHDKWLNDAVKEYLSEKGDFSEFLSLSHLRVFVAQPEYLLAMKCLSFRLGPEFADEADVRFLLRYLNITASAEALAIVTRYYPQNMLPQKTFYALQEILGG